MIERTEKQHCVGRAVGVRQMPGVADFGRCERMIRLLRRRSTRLLHMLRYRVEQMHIISKCGQPAGINSRASTGIDDRRWGGR
jgi:hypothetical protein